MDRDDDAEGALRTMSASEFVCRLREFQGQPDVHYVSWLGAGCSVTSGIPAAAALVRDQWIPRLYKRKRVSGANVEEWAKAEFSGYTPDNAGGFYGSVMESLFNTPDDRQRETERLCDGQSPSFGYGVLAALMSRDDGFFSTTLTTNFDDLVADAMYVFGTKRPLVIQHESLAGFARPGRVQRPLVVKIHGDHRLNPIHTAQETAELKESIAVGIRGLLHDRGVVFIGYAGNDSGVLSALEELPDGAMPLGVWWVSRSEPTGLIRPWLESRDATWVKAQDFDELMLLMRDEFEIEHPTAQRFDRMFTTYRETYERLNTNVGRLSDAEADSRSLKEAAAKATTEAPVWWRALLEARELEDADPERAEKLYERALQSEPDDPVIAGSYALFLKRKLNDPGRTEAMFERAIAADPAHAINLANYARFLDDKRDDPDRTEAMYERAIAADPANTNSLGSYALFVGHTRDDPDRAEEMLQRTLRTDPKSANALGGLALFFGEKRDDPDRAEEFYERAIAEDSEHAINLGNYARFLGNKRDDPDRAEEFYERAIAVDPSLVNNLDSFALFLGNKRDDPDRAEEFYERAIAADPEDADSLGNFAGLLVSRGNRKRAEEMIGRAFALAEVPRDRSLLVELWVYVLCLGDPEREREAIEELAKLIRGGARSPGWSFDKVLARAREDGVNDFEWIERLAAVVAVHADEDVLEGWAAWPVR